MVQIDPRAEENATIIRKNRKKYSSGSFRCVCPFLVVVGPFSGVQNRKNFEFFFLESIKNGLKRISNQKSREKIFHPPSKFLRWPYRNFWTSLEDPKPVKPNILKDTGSKFFRVSFITV